MVNISTFKNETSECDKICSILESVNINLDKLIKHQRENPYTRGGKRTKGIMSEVLKHGIQKQFISEMLAKKIVQEVKQINKKSISPAANQK